MHDQEFPSTGNRGRPKKPKIISSEGLRYAQVVKTRKNGVLEKVKKKIIFGNPLDIEHSQISTTLIRQSNRKRKSQCYVMDKGYDSEKIHALIREKVKAESIIPVRERKRKKVKGKIENSCI
jgi:SOS response regulatory protein OraA/RecX